MQLRRRKRSVVRKHPRGGRRRRQLRRFRERLEWNGAGVLRERLHVGTRLVEHALDGIVGGKDCFGKIRLFDVLFCVACAIEKPGRIRPGTSFAQSRLYLRREHQQLASGLHDDLTHITPGRGDDLHRLTLR